MKERIQKLINVYCTYMFGTDRDAGWHTPSQLDITQYKSNSGSDLLRITKFEARYCAADLHQINDKPDEKMINEMQYIRKKHFDFELAKMLFSKLADKQLLALFAERYLKYVYKRVFTEEEVAEYLKVSKSSYRHNKRTAAAKILEGLVFIDQYEEAKKV